MDNAKIKPSLEERANAVKSELEEKIGRKNFVRLMVWAFEYACKEAEIWNIRIKGQDFEKIAQSRRNFVICEIYQALEGADIPREFELQVPDYSAIDALLKEEYVQQKNIRLRLLGNALVHTATRRY